MYYSKLREKLEEVFFKSEENMCFDFELNDYTEKLKEIVAIRKKNNLSFKLYRFSGADYWNIRNLDCSQLVLSDVGKMNDVFEGTMSEPGYYIQPDDNKVLGELVSLKCFSEDWRNLLMWAHYANKYFGICVEYDLTLLPDNDYVFSYLYPVLYKNNRRQISHFIKNSARELRAFKAALLLREYPNSVDWMNNVTAWYLEKSKDWKYEKEWRIIVPFFDRYAAEHSEDGRYEHNVYENGVIPFDCATAVYLGTRTVQTVEDHIIEIVERINTKREYDKKPIQVFRTCIHESKYKLKSIKVL